jgi:hypothetical protein
MVCFAAPASAQSLHHIGVAAGIGYTDPLDSVPGSGSGGFAEIEYTYRAVEWLTPGGYVGTLITGSREDCGSGVEPCDVSASVGLIGVRLRLMAPVPYVAPFVEGGVGASLGSVETRVGQVVAESSSGVTVHLPVAVGLALGEFHEFEIGLRYLFHPRERQVGSAFALGFGFAID